MNPRCYVLTAALFVSLLSGCQSAREAYMVDAINTGDLILEDKIYELSNRMDELEARMDLLRGNRPLRPTGRSESTSGESSSPSSESTSPDEENPDLSPPEVEPGTPANPEDLPSDEENTSTARKVNYETADEDDVVEVSIAEVRPENFDDQPGDDGIVVVLDPKNNRGETILEPAKIEIIVGDPALRLLGKGAHIGHWEFPPDSVAHAAQNTDRLQAIVLELPWTQIPQHNKLDLFVQYTRPDGEKLQNRIRFNTNVHPNQNQNPNQNPDVSSQWSARSASAPRRQPPQVEPAPAPSSEQEDGPPVEVYQ